jgi:hypothetical protein
LKRRREEERSTPSNASPEAPVLYQFPSETSPVSQNAPSAPATPTTIEMMRLLDPGFSNNPLNAASAPPRRSARGRKSAPVGNVADSGHDIYGFIDSNENDV